MNRYTLGLFRLGRALVFVFDVLFWKGILVVVIFGALLILGQGIVEFFTDRVMAPLPGPVLLVFLGLSIWIALEAGRVRQ